MGENKEKKNVYKYKMYDSHFLAAAAAGCVFL
jgi:hypothetical protein